MKTIGFYDDSAGPSGTTRYLLELLSALDRTEYQAVVFSPSPSPWHEAAREAGAQIIAGPAATPSEILEPARPAMLQYQPPPPPGPWSAARRAVAWHLAIRRETAALRSLFSSTPVDLLHSNNAGEEVAPIAARRAGIPTVIATLHVDPTYDLFGERRAPRHLKLQRSSLQALDLAIAVSQRTAEEWQRHLQLGRSQGPRLAVVSNGIRLERLTRRRTRAEAKLLLDLPPTALVIGSLGRLDHAKGYGDLVASLPAVLRLVPEAIFVHAGSGPLAHALATEAARLGVSQQVRWLGFRPDVRDLLEACDIYVQPSWCEAHTLSVLEAGALAVATVATDVGGHAETLEDGVAGWVVQPRAPEQLATALIAAALAPVERESKGRRLGERVRSYYTHDRMVAETMALYHSLTTPGVRE